MQPRRILSVVVWLREKQRRIVSVAVRSKRIEATSGRLRYGRVAVPTTDPQRALLLAGEPLAQER